MALTDNLNAYWKFDENSGNAADSSGNGTTLTNNGTVTYAAAKINNGAVLASGKYFSVADNGFVSLTGDATWQIWWYPTTLNAQNSFFDKWNFSTSQREYEVFANYSAPTTTIYFQNSTNGTNATNINKTTTSISVNNWYHLVWVYTASSGQCEIYLNGSSLGAGTGLGTSIFNGTSAFSIGQFTGTGGNLAGTIDEAAIWSRALTSTEVTELYNGGAGLQYPFSSGATFRPHMMLI